MGGNEEEILKGREGDQEEALIANRKILELPSIVLPRRFDIRHACLRGTPMAPLDDLVNLFPIALKDCFHRTVPTVSHPAFHTQPLSHLLRVMTEENPLNASLDDDPCPHPFHNELIIITTPFGNQTQGPLLGNASLCRGNSTESDRNVGESLIPETSDCPLARGAQLPIERTLL